jgi:hypothetical protein
MKVLRISKYLPDTVNSTEHPRAAEMKELLDDMARSYGGEVKKFEVKDGGVAVVEFSKEEVIEKVSDDFQGLNGPEVATLSALQVQFEALKAHQETIDKKRASKEDKKRKDKGN